jgi:O-antigen/teichoic acid export membrane protein
MTNQSFFRHAAVYGLANLLVQAAGLVLLPVYTRCLNPDDYGVLEVLGRLAETVGTCLLFGGLRQTLLTFYQQSEHEAERRRIVSTTLTLLGGTCLAGGALMFALAGPLSELLTNFTRQSDKVLVISADLVQLALLGILLEPLSLMPLALVQARLESATFVLITLAQFLVRVTLCVVLVAWFGWGVAGVLTATAVTGALFGVGLSLRELARGPAWPDGAQMRALLRFALPFLPGGICFFLLHHGDRFFLLRYWTTKEVGTYALGYKLALAAGMFSLTPLYMVWSARMYAAARRADAPVVFGQIFTRILAAYLLVGLGLCLFQDEVVALVGKPAYAPAAAVVAPVVLACFFQSASSLMDAGFYVRHHTGLKLGTTLAATAVMLVLYAVLIPRHGSMGAALATLGGFAFLAASTFWTTQRIFPVRYEWLRLAAMLSLAVALWLASRPLPVAAWAAPLKAVLWLLAPVLAWQTGLVSRAEKKYLRGLAAEVLTPLLDGAAQFPLPWPDAPAIDTDEYVPARRRAEADDRSPPPQPEEKVARV